MTQDNFCPTHGPYDSAYSVCPYCSGNYQRPPAPTPLSEDDQPTDLGNSRSPSPGPAPYSEDDAPTDLGVGQRGGRGFLDIDDEEPTQLGRYSRDDDVTELDFVQTGLLGILWVRDGNRRGHIYKIKEGTVIGRKEGDVVIDDPKVSNPHAKLTIEDEQFVLWDFASKNGTFVNGERIRAATLLKENDTVKVGDTLFVLKVLES